MASAQDLRYLYFICPRCFTLTEAEYLPLSDLICEKCYGEIFSKEPKNTMPAARQETILQEIRLEKLNPFKCSVKIIDKNNNKTACNGTRFFYKGLSVCFSCHRQFFQPCLFMDGKEKIKLGAPVVLNKVGNEYAYSRKEIAREIFERQKSVEVLIFETVHPLDNNYKIYFAWPTIFKRPRFK